MLFFFKQKTAYEMRISDWSSDVCSSDLTNNGPTLIEHFTYRAEGHSTSDDPSAYRAAQEASAWPFGDPVARLRQHLEALGEWDAERHEAQRTEMEELVKTTQQQIGREHV